MPALTRRLAVFGWTADSERLLTLLEERTELRAVALGEGHPSMLLRARATMELPRYHHLLEMARTADYDVALIDDVEDAVTVITAAAERGADILLRADCADAAVLEAAAQASSRHGVALLLLRPLLRSAGFGFLTARLSEDGWRPRLVSVDASGDRPALALMRDALAAHTRLLPARPLQVAASFAGAQLDPDAVAVQLRLLDGGLALLTARRAESTELHVSVRSEAGSTEFTASGDHSTFTTAARGAAAETATLPQGDLLAAEVDRVAASVRGDALDALLAPREAALLRAIEASLAGELAHTVEDHVDRPALRLLGGGGHASTIGANGPDRTPLTLVSG